MRGRVLPIATLAAASAAVAAATVRAYSAPAEDAAMLMRYVEHVAAGHGVVWNIGDPPVDGATDLLPMLMAAGLASLGPSAETAVKVIAMGAHLLTAGVVLWAGRVTRVALLVSLVVLFGPGWTYANVGFTTPVFGLMAAVLAVTTFSRGVSMQFGIAAVLLTLARPEGLALAGLLIVAAVVTHRAVPLRPLVGLALGLGGYLLVRRWYFGDWIPSSYFTKGAFELHVPGLMASTNYVLRFIGFAAIPAVWVWRADASVRRHLVAIAIPVIGFTGLWILLSSETDFGGRFQYAVLPVVAAWLAASAPSWWPSSRAARAACLAVLAMAGLANLAQYRPVAMADGRREVGQALATFAMTAESGGPPGRRTMVVTEAGLVPLYSRWRAVDALGLNDADIARHRLERSRLERERPDLILVHRSFPLVPRPTAEDRHDRMTDAVVGLFDYAREHRYVLAAAWGATPANTHIYLVRPEAPDAEALVAVIRGTPYACLGSVPGMSGLGGSIRRALDAVRGRSHTEPVCRDWPEEQQNLSERAAPPAMPPADRPATGR